MYPSKHVTYSLFILLFFLIILPYGGIFPYTLIFLSSILIDTDHYLLYAYRKKNLSLVKAWKWYLMLANNPKEGQKQIPFLHFFHTVEFLAFVFILSFFYKIFLWVFIGIAFHGLLDILSMKEKKLFEQREYFLIRSLLRKR